jgi:succinate dehydrogenase / fumarate reductase iron-sulfur subunit
MTKTTQNQQGREAGETGAADAPAPTRLVRLKVFRQDSVEAPKTRRHVLLEVPYRPGMTVADALIALEDHPLEEQGKRVPPPRWDGECLEGMCGACTMLVNGKVRKACRTLVDEVERKGRPIELEPLGKFPLVQDLSVDRGRMFETLASLKVWLEVDRERPATAPRMPAAHARELLALSSCTHCGACLEACPEYGEHGDYVGAAALNQVRLMVSHPTGEPSTPARLDAVMTKGGIADCGKAQNCAEVCPAGVPLVDSLTLLARDTTQRMLFGWLLR